MSRALVLLALLCGCATGRTCFDNCAPGSDQPPGASKAAAQPAAAAQPPAAAIDAVLDGWHDAAARADEERYFSAFAPDGVFLGTDATERWEVAAFRAFAHPYFAKGKAWTMRPSNRHVTVEGDTAFFDESLATTYGPCRGSGVLRRIGGAWKIAQYNLALTIPNDRVRAVQELLARPR